MRNIIIITLLTLTNLSFAQIAIGTEEPRGASLLDLGSGSLNGILLPYNTNTKNPINGTFRVDANTSKIQYYSENNWVDLTEEGLMPVTYNKSDDNKENAGVVISDQSSIDNNLTGVLVLESDNKALTLPQIINPHLNVIDPPTGMICYDPLNKVLAIYNGAYWYFYK